MTYRVIVTPHAELQILEADLWWLEHRDKAPGLFQEDLEETLAKIAAAPLVVGKRFRNRAVPEARRVLMPKTRDHVYFVVDEVTRTATIITVWGSIKERDPDLSAIGPR